MFASLSLGIARQCGLSFFLVAEEGAAMASPQLLASLAAFVAEAACNLAEVEVMVCDTQAIVRLLMPEGVTQQRHSALRLPDVTVNHR